VPDEPTVYLKSPDTVIGLDDEVLVPRGSTKTDWGSRTRGRERNHGPLPRLARIGRSRG
jgi:hypothetical protein